MLLLVCLGGVILSFNGLTRVGELAGYGRLSWIFAGVVDAGAAASTIYWLTGTPGSARGRWATRQALTLLAVSIACNAASHLVTVLNPWAIALVATVPPAVIAATVHLLVTRETIDVTNEPGSQVAPVQATAEVGDSERTPQFLRAVPAIEQKPADPAVDQLRAWIAEDGSPPSNRAIQERFNVGFPKAKKLLEQATATSGVTR